MKWKNVNGKAPLFLDKIKNPKNFQQHLIQQQKVEDTISEGTDMDWLRNVQNVFRSSSLVASAVHKKLYLPQALRFRDKWII